VEVSICSILGKGKNPKESIRGGLTWPEETPSRHAGGLKIKSPTVGGGSRGKQRTKVFTQGEDRRGDRERRFCRKRHRVGEEWAA